jgi:methylase of polypeptide subunit release factors
MDRGGFDAVIGNPPYIFSHELISVEEREYFRALYLGRVFKIDE